MQLIRALHRDKYDDERQRFTSDSFKNNERGISVIDAECIHEAGAEYCVYIERYYGKTLDGQPFAYWVIEMDCLLEDFKDGFEIVKEKSTTGDDCHRNIVGIKNKQAQKWAKKNCKPPNVFLCAGDIGVCLTKDQFQNLSTAFRTS